MNRRLTRDGRKPSAAHDAPDGSPQDAVGALQAALAAEHLAVHGYGVVGAQLSGSAKETASEHWRAHRAHRDALAARLRDHAAEPVAAAPAYRLPVSATGPGSARRLAARLEDAALAAHVALAGTAEPALRRMAAQAMQDAAARAVRWRGGAPADAFPGLPPEAVDPRGAAGP